MFFCWWQELEDLENDIKEIDDGDSIIDSEAEMFSLTKKKNTYKESDIALFEKIKSSFLEESINDNNNSERKSKRITDSTKAKLNESIQFLNDTKALCSIENILQEPVATCYADSNYSYVSSYMLSLTTYQCKYECLFVCSN